jgi:branched-chain amino acid transport system ATP-binding protein
VSEHLVQVRGLCGGYGTTQVLFDVDVNLPPRSCVALLGLNGAGKSTLLETLMGALAPWTGKVLLDGRDVTGTRTDLLIRQGIGYVPQEQSVFASLSVRENLMLGATVVEGSAAALIEEILTLFPKLGTRLRQAAGTLSGGERKMLALARALLGDPRLLILDEVTEGVWPGVVDEIGARLREFARTRSLLLVEHNVGFALDIADHVYVLDRGRIVVSGPTEEVRSDPRALLSLAPGAQPEDGKAVGTSAGSIVAALGNGVTSAPPRRS